MQKKIRNTEDSVWVVQIYEENAVEKNDLRLRLLQSLGLQTLLEK